MKKSYRFILIGSLLLFISMCCAYDQGMNPFIHILKYSSAAYGITLYTQGIWSFYSKRRRLRILYYFGIVLLVLYTILLVDTYLIHAIDCFPGIVRYAIFSIYWEGYLIFVLPGTLLYWGSWD